ncbi:MAG: DinB family protein [Actinobacteria bacterium]|jgi:hypothetical protein|nr:DinB family protein [Actinomycetota bacterium]
MDIRPDTKDWTWVLDRPCPECGFDSRSPERQDLADLAAAVGGRWADALSAAGAAQTRPGPSVWSPLEYACHVRDVYALADYRVRLMLDEDDPLFANWDQDATAVESDYSAQDPRAVSVQVRAVADAFAGLLAGMDVGGWARSGRRSDGAAFTVESFTRYVLHDVVHHLTDVTGAAWA